MELWALLHFKDQRTHIHRRYAQSELRKYISGYKKHLPFPILVPRYDSAVSRAKALDEHHDRAGHPGENPSSGVYRLTEQLIRYSKEEYISKIR